MDKRALRERLKAARATLTPAQMTAEADHVVATVLDLPEIRAARQVFCYISSPAELATDDLIDGLLARDIEVAVPRVVDRTTMLAVAFPGWDRIERGAFEIRQPAVREPVVDDVDVVITPALGFAPSGARIGYGGGYYDRWFEAHPDARRIGVAFDAQLVETLPVEAHDVLMHRIISGGRHIDLENTR